MKFKLKRKFILRMFFGLIILLLTANLVVHYLMVYYGTSENKWLTTAFKAFDFDTETNFPTLFSASILLFNAILLIIISKYKKVKYSYLWLFLGIVFIFLSFDEILQFHEHLVEPMRTSFNASGYFNYAWVIPYSFFIMVLGVCCYRLLFNYLPSKSRNLFILAGVLFLCGAIGMEMFCGKYAETYGEATETYFFMYTIEETLEMLGASIFCYALLDYIFVTIRRVKVVF